MASGKDWSKLVGKRDDSSLGGGEVGIVDFFNTSNKLPSVQIKYNHDTFSLKKTRALRLHLCFHLKSSTFETGTKVTGDLK